MRIIPFSQKQNGIFISVEGGAGLSSFTDITLNGSLYPEMDTKPAMGYKIALKAGYLTKFGLYFNTGFTYMKYAQKMKHDGIDLHPEDPLYEYYKKDFTRSLNSIGVPLTIGYRHIINRIALFIDGGVEWKQLSNPKELTADDYEKTNYSIIANAGVEYLLTANFSLFGAFHFDKTLKEPYEWKEPSLITGSAWGKPYYYGLSIGIKYHF